MSIERTFAEDMFVAKEITTKSSNRIESNFASNNVFTGSN